MPVQNAEIADAFDEIVDLLEAGDVLNAMAWKKIQKLLQKR